MKNNELNKDDVLLSTMDILKIQTQACHKQTEQVSTMKRLFAPDYALTEYCLHLEKMYGYLSVFEPLLLQALDNELRAFFQPRSRMGLLKKDLLNFGLTSEQILALPVCSAPTYIAKSVHSLGAYYVLEGSSLGGQLICKHLNAHFGDVVANKLHFYAGHGEQTRVYWQQFGVLINSRFSNENQPEVAELLNAAKLTFGTIADWLNNCSL